MREELYKRLICARGHMDPCYTEQMTLERLAPVSLFSQAYFLRRFENYFGVTRGSHLIGRLMEAAEMFLKQNKEVPVTEICLEVGYDDLSSFRKLFKHLSIYGRERNTDSVVDIFA